MRGKIINHVLVKTGKQVQKFWKHKGYAVAVADLEEVRGVKLHTEYDGILYARRDQFYKNGIENVYNGEQQLVLPTKHWEILESTK
jgi:hypothetical protein